MSVEECEVCFIVTDGTFLRRNAVGLLFDFGFLGGYHLAVDMVANQRRQLKSIDNLSPRELNGVEWEKKKFLSERGAGMIAAYQVLCSWACWGTVFVYSIFNSFWNIDRL